MNRKPDHNGRVWVRWDEWECFNGAFWESKTNIPKDKQELVVADFFRLNNGTLFDICCGAMISSWTNSCEHNLTNTDMNRIAWLGQASVAFSLGIQNSVTMKAWSLLSDTEKNNANKIAEKHLDLWEKNRGN